MPKLNDFENKDDLISIKHRQPHRSYVYAPVPYQFRKSPCFQIDTEKHQPRYNSMDAEPQSASKSTA